MKNLPKTIYLQIGEHAVDNDDFKDLDEEELTFATNRVYQTDIEYFRKKQLVAEEIPGFQESLDNLTEHQKYDIDLKMFKAHGWTSEVLPPLKPGYSHSEECVVYYEAIEGGKTSGYGISYYHADPPYQNPCWIDFANYGRQPIKWMGIPK